MKIPGTAACAGSSSCWWRDGPANAAGPASAPGPANAAGPVRAAGPASAPGPSCASVLRRNPSCR
ncbi:MAG: hypothetical protein F4Y38_11730 [Gemmatimonadetes bacterium]|nr:hypothetical protein [Gemmatimonadota bacterium]MYG86721.1 hypothetical protein [Gemmatimonadota bacterium]MYJ88512.1 hypothetical protein [Gemmatimonadota bacterium]